MQPLQLTLKGFRGIRDGLGLDEITLDLERLTDGAHLIAIAGANGRGKTTVIENLVPQLNLPSRAGAGSPGGFSYYDHVYLPESLKDLTWAHEGRSYRSQIVVRLNGRRRTEAFLHVLDDAGRWQPVRLEDGTVADGKVETYTRCVEAICGSADTFYTSVFASQGKRQLSTYRNAEIKTLLADLLGQEEIRALGSKAAETARLLKAGLLVIRQELAVIGADRQRVHDERQRLEGCVQRVPQTAGARGRAQLALESAQTEHARRRAERDQARMTDARRSQLAAERKAIAEAATRQRAALQAHEQNEVQRLDRLQQRIVARQRQERARHEALCVTRRRCLDALDDAGHIAHAVARLPLVERILSVRVERTRAAREGVQQQHRAQAAVRQAEQQLDAIERDAGRAALKAQELSVRFGLAGEVPCVGTDLQGRCKLLGDARQAETLMPSAQGEVARLAGEKRAAQNMLANARQQLAALADASRRLELAEQREARARERAGHCAVLAARTGECQSAQQRLLEVNKELDALGAAPSAGEGGVQGETTEEAAEREQVVAARRRIAGELQRVAEQADESLKRIDAVLGALPAPYDERRLETVARTEAQARVALADAERAHLRAQQDVQMLESLKVQAGALAERHARADARRIQVEDELGNWNLFARCMSHDGLIALAIDDAGPALSGLANELLQSCYGPRFTVSIRTLVQTAKGDDREGFDIVVHDAENGEHKSVGLMSGGERSWIESVLTRAIALYLAQHTGRRYATLFSDEADGPLDPDRKRMFMAMKRAVLRLGGYEREYFISQTPELTAMADAVIDLDAMASREASAFDNAARSPRPNVAMAELQ